MLEAMADFWQKHPPLHTMVQGYLGIETEAKPAADISEFFASVQRKAAP